ncbi:coiled-coil domain-containing protein 34-like [Ruditapes philippinarum]|uniref:coiled-coil domain-containing protein 34-like n=1 Tax=Ruditapes philippinarum TaxID=129788 RepID=UPI00295A7055|nr:coiled-coil domain-containing protein 34-like [Ruditapes philippinarum]
MNRKSRSKEKMTSLRPRPVTATVTKPKWMQPEAIVGPRSASVESRGSTASLTSVLDHDSYISCSDDEDEFEDKRSPRQSEVKRRPGKENVPIKNQQDIHNNTFNVKHKKVMKKKVIRKFVESSVTDDTEADSPEPGMSPWEQWLIDKVKEDRDKRREERQKKREEKRKKDEEAAIQQRKLQQAELVRKEWVEKKNFEETLKKKVEKQREKTEKMIKEEKKKMESVKAERIFEEWKEKKKEEEKEKKRKEKQKQAEEERLRKSQKIKAQQQFEEWCRKADSRPKPMPNSFGYTSGKLTGYHDTCAYPVPTFYNPMPWQPIHIPRPASERKPRRRTKTRPKSAWNPEKYR